MAALVASLPRPPMLHFGLAKRPNFGFNACTRIRYYDNRKPLPMLMPCRASSENKEEANEDDKKPDNDTVGSAATDGSIEESQEPSKVMSGSPLPGVKAPLENFKIPKGVLDVIRNQVFSFDTFFPIEQEDYEAGVIFKGNLRGEPAKSYAKLSSRLQDRFGEEYKLFLISDPNGDKPIAAVVRNLSLQSDPGAVPDWFAVASFGLVTVTTILLRNSPALQLNFLAATLKPGLLLDALPGALVTISVLLAHELGHYLAAQKIGANLGLPYFIPSWQLGSFGGITRIRNVLKDRKELIEVVAAGPLAGALFSLSIITLGFLLPPREGQGLLVNSSVFHDSLLVGGIAKLLLGESLQEGATFAINPVVLSAWSGLLINAINSIPVGELDGGRLAQALWGRKAWSRWTGVSIGLLGISGLFSDVALYWVVLIVFLQRGPIAPQADEITSPSGRHVLAGVAVLLLSLLVCVPFPFSFS